MIAEISIGTFVERAIKEPPVWIPARIIDVNKIPIGLYPEISAALSPTHA